MFKVAITGNIGTGKTTISKIFSKLQVPVISADEINKELIAPNTRYYKKIVTKFGDRIIINNTINTKALKEIIFHDLTAKLWLEELLHPAIISTMQQRITTFKDAYCILEIPLLIEANLTNIVNYVIVVTAEYNNIQNRLQIRDGTDNKINKKIISHQASLTTQQQYADYIIENNNDISTLTEQVQQLHKILLTKSLALTNNQN